MPRSSVKYFTDALFSMMPECNDIVEIIQLMNFLLFEGQANKGILGICKKGLWTEFDCKVTTDVYLNFYIFLNDLLRF